MKIKRWTKMNKRYENKNIFSVSIVSIKDKRWIYTNNVPILGTAKERK